mgnify:CR=1 FL=1
MDFIDLKYIRLVSVYLSGFKEVSSSLYRCRCPLCGDSKKSQSKTRGYIFVREGKVFYMCHNCQWSGSLYKLMQEVAPSLCRSYVLDRFGEKKVKTEVPKAKSTELVRRLIKDELFHGCERISTLPSSHPSRAYLEGRKIPEDRFFELFHIDNVVDFAEKLERYQGRNFQKSPAILIPFYDEDRSIMYVSARLLDGDLRYITFEVQGGKKIYGLDKVDWTKLVYVCEGPFDSMFVDNCIAVAGASIIQEVKYLRERTKAGYVLIFDRDYTTNKEIYDNLEKAIESGMSVILYDAKFKAKDINDAIEAGMTRESLMDYLEDRTFSGMNARLEFGRVHPPRARNYGKAKEKGVS